MTEYAPVCPISLGAHYTKHVSAMTSEGLHEKSDIAIQLAHRDLCIEHLENDNRMLSYTSEYRRHEIFSLNRQLDSQAERIRYLETKLFAKEKSRA